MDPSSVNDVAAAGRDALEESSPDAQGGCPRRVGRKIRGGIPTSFPSIGPKIHRKDSLPRGDENGNVIDLRQVWISKGFKTRWKNW